MAAPCAGPFSTAGLRQSVLESIGRGVRPTQKIGPFSYCWYRSRLGLVALRLAACQKPLWVESAALKTGQSLPVYAISRRFWSPGGLCIGANNEVNVGALLLLDEA